MQRQNSNTLENKTNRKQNSLTNNTPCVCTRDKFTTFTNVNGLENIQLFARTYGYIHMACCWSKSSVIDFSNDDIKDSAYKKLL